MKQGWFQHSYLSEEQANELVERYGAKNIKTEKSLSADYKTWTVSALLPESANPPRVDRTYQNRYWG
ncbi:hypothetical protein MUA02_04425 [Enterobacteriaceae bacterium H20N1]|uniref:Uncharacterized protein n=1 Tax=Dryocola boscaweniae TaxID=2925397 RepID=A0A9X2W5C0_9ENTR|nr:hypothetical protein [Dryocola boscaweniae]MCT4701199.1 hypothetical protein [Dryocola boscaweniae]MCT4718296.1 hypothetical protein [Dryocola boscaweniae]